MAGTKRDASKAKGAGKAAPKALVDAAAEVAALTVASAEVAEAQARAVDLIAGVVALKANQRIIPPMIREGRRDGIARAVRVHDTPALYDWFMGLLSMQGISDRNALSYIHRHGNATYSDVGRRLASTRCACPKLQSFASFTGCGYRKDACSCANPQHLRLCPVRQLPLRKGLLNIQAVSLHRWLTDVCEGDLVAWIDRAIATAKAEGDAGVATPHEARLSPPGCEPEPDTNAQAATQLEALSPAQDSDLEGNQREGEQDGRNSEVAKARPASKADRAGAGQASGVSSAGTRAVNEPTAAHAAVPPTGQGRRHPLPPVLPHLDGVEPWAWRAKISLVASLSAIEGVSDKLANMTLAALMIGGRPKDPDWLAVASLMVTVDSLIHNMLARTGILAAFGAEHAYGPRCYGLSGCEAVIYRLTEAICARETAASLKFEPPNPRASATPQLTPVEVQKALWRFCTAGVLDFCNAARVGLGLGCTIADVCPVRHQCRRAVEQRLD